MFKFDEGAVVSLKADYPSLGLKAGDQGIVFAIYSTNPPDYEITFQGPDGAAFDGVFSEAELAEPVDTRQEAKPARKRSQAAA